MPTQAAWTNAFGKHSAAEERLPPAVAEARLPDETVHLPADSGRLEYVEIGFTTGSFFEVREEEPSDALAVAEAHIASWLASAEGKPASKPSVEAWAFQRAQRISELGQCRTLVADSGSEIIGHITWTRPQYLRLPCGRIWSCYVIPNYWGTGVADGLMRRVLADLYGADVDLLVFRNNHRARNFYERHGFILAGLGDPYSAASLESPNRDYVRYLRII